MVLQSLQYYSREFEDKMEESFDLLITIKVDHFINTLDNYLMDNNLQLSDVIPEEYSMD